MPRSTTDAPHFSRKTFLFLKKAARQKRPDWLDRNRGDYEEAVLDPLEHLATFLKTELGPAAAGYHFPQRGIGRIRRPANRIREHGGSTFKSWISYSAARPRVSRFSHNPNLYFMIDPLDSGADSEDPVLVAGGLYMPSSQQLKAIRQAIAEDARPFDRLFASREFSKQFPGGFSDEKISGRSPRGFDPDHPRQDWLRLQAYFVWRPYRLREFFSPSFPALLARDWKQILRLNELLDRALEGRLSVRREPAKASKQEPRLSERLGQIADPRRQMDF